MVVTIGRFGRTTRIHSRGHAALVDGDSARVAGSWRDAHWTNHHVYDPAGILHLRHAWNIFVGYSLERRAVPAAGTTQWHCIFTGRASVLFN